MVRFSETAIVGALLMPVIVRAITSMSIPAPAPVCPRSSVVMVMAYTPNACVVGVKVMLSIAALTLASVPVNARLEDSPAYPVKPVLTLRLKLPASVVKAMLTVSPSTSTSVTDALNETGSSSVVVSEAGNVLTGGSLIALIVTLIVNSSDSGNDEVPECPKSLAQIVIEAGPL
ncbi:MAG: hypothetical protein OMM_05838 [Candidatus Magnetoglobus multicellularis str. Araruama]|uniref:Uncharacterized protein n=1 Tax=Candidatus Magnetoglobus multicellularis str. Araruama TaxID=890399 RepID=A0A1V1NTU5_9BACT|nr:MAG: hypothetical protein OMM_05838 [Candidatus Magnetoglobus multicellularis str. Araruama]